MKRMFQVFAAVVFTTVLASAGRLCADGTPAAASKGMAAALQPFVDSHTLAGAVTLVATKDKVLELEAVGYADIAAKQADADRLPVLDRLAVQADHGHGPDDARRRGQSEASTIRWRSTCRSSTGRWLTVGARQGPRAAEEAEASDHGQQRAEPHQRPAVHSRRSRQPTLDLFPLACRVRSYAMLPLDFEPDSKYQYSNAGINTAGRIIEVVSGMPLREVSRQAACSSRWA